jgi:hypothetical protein
MAVQNRCPWWPNHPLKKGLQPPKQRSSIGQFPSGSHHKSFFLLNYDNAFRANGSGGAMGFIHFGGEVLVDDGLATGAGGMDLLTELIHANVDRSIPWGCAGSPPLSATSSKVAPRNRE